MSMLCCCATACNISNGDEGNTTDGTKDRPLDTNTDTDAKQSGETVSAETEVEEIEIVTETIVIEVAEEETEAESGNSKDPDASSGVAFLRLDGLNAVGKTLYIYGDFAGDADVDDLTDIVWEKSDCFDSGYAPPSCNTLKPPSPLQVRSSQRF